MERSRRRFPALLSIAESPTANASCVDQREGVTVLEMRQTGRPCRGPLCYTTSTNPADRTGENWEGRRSGGRNRR